MSSRAAASVLLHRLAPRIFSPAPPSAAAPRSLLALTTGSGQRGTTLLARLLSISASEATADVAEVHAAKGKHLSAAAVKAEVALVSSRVVAASEAKADVAEVYASKVDYAGIAAAKAEGATISASEAKADVAEVYASKEKDAEWKGKEPSD